ncbi:MAG: prolyl oligopeptidase family serine peptidase [Acidimicrobiales bacterium]
MAPLPVDMCLPWPEVSDVRVRPGGRSVTAVLSGDASGTRPARLVMWDLATGEMTTVTDDPSPATGRGMSGGVHDWHPDGGSLVYAAADGSLHRWTESTSRIEQLAFPAGRRWWGPCHSPEGMSVAAVADWCELAVMSGDGRVHSVHRETDGFVMDAAWNGNTPTAHRWTRPEMAWTRSGLVGEPESDGVGVQQPHGRAGSFGVVTDATGAWNVTVDGAAVDDGLEHGGPTWGPGQRTWCLNDDATMVAYTRNESGFGSLWVMHRATGERVQVGRAVHGCVSWSGDTLAAVRSGARTPQQVVAYDMSDASSPRRSFVWGPASPAWRDFDDELVEPTVHSADSVPWRLYRPASPNGRLIVWVHGGPTDQWQVTWRPRFTWWLSRGWTIAVPDHRGSTGHGRSHRLALEGGWGAVDADDTALVARHARAVLGITADRTVLMGSSAGGLGVLAAAARHAGLAACAVVCYPVTDLELLLATPDAFEGHYNLRLVGDPSVSPVASPGHLSDVPVLAFHGDRDELVVPAHSLRLRDAVAAVGGSVEVVVMPGEGHGFRDPANIAHEFALTQAFVEDHVGRT